MATFSQFKSKYITEKREPLRGDSLNKNIVKRVVTDPLENIKKNQIKVDKRIASDASASLGDGGKEAMKKFDKEFGLNDTDTKGRNIKKKQVQLNKTSNQNISTNTVDDSVKSVKTNRKTVDKTTKSNVVKGSGDGITGSKGNTTVKPNTNTVTNTKKTSNIKGQIDQALKDYQSKLKNQVNKPKVNVNQTPKTNVSLPDFTKQKTSFSGRIGNVTNIKTNKGPQIPDFKKTPTPDFKVRDLSTKREIKRIFDRDRLNRGLKNIDTADLDKQISTKIDDKLSKRAFQDFRKDSSLTKLKTDISKKIPKKVLKFGGPVLAAADSAISFRNIYKQSQAKGDTKRRSLGRAASTVAGGLIGGALGAAGGSAIAPGAGTYIGGYGGYVAGQELGQKAFDTLTTSKGRKQIAKSFKNFRNRAMKPVGS